MSVRIPISSSTWDTSSPWRFTIDPKSPKSIPNGKTARMRTPVIWMVVLSQVKFFAWNFKNYQKMFRFWSWARCVVFKRGRRQRLTVKIISRLRNKTQCSKIISFLSDFIKLFSLFFKTFMRIILFWIIPIPLLKSYFSAQKQHTHIYPKWGIP